MASTSASPQDHNELLEQLGMPVWIEQFLQKEFFCECSTHHCERNELNRYCTTCNAPACVHCLGNGGHDDHHVLTIYRHVYQGVVPLIQMEERMNCSRIQKYRCNKKLVISLKPLPHKGSGSRIEGPGACIICKRKLTSRDDRFVFCSIACNLHEVLRRIHAIKTGRETLAKRAKPAVNQQASASANDSQATMPEVDRPAAPTFSNASQARPADDQQASGSQAARKRSRKGVPERASTRV